MKRLGLLVGLGLSALYAQDCAPSPILPVGQFSGSLAATSCTLSDGTPYAAYRLVLPGRGQLQTSLNPSATNLNLILQDSTGTQLTTGASLQRQVEAGSYTLIVNGQTPAAGWNGPAAYTIQNSFTAEPGTWCANFPAIGLNQQVNGMLGSAGCTAPDRSPYDGWTINTLGGGTLTVSVSSTAITPSVTVRGADGTALGTDPASVSIPVTPFTTYQIVVASSDTTGSYQLTTSFTPNTTETCVPQKTLSGPMSENNNVTPTSCSVVIDSFGDLAYFNYYNLTVSAGGLADIAVTSTDFSPMLYLLDAAGNVLTIDSGAGGYTAGTGTYSGIRFPLAPGNYTVQVFSNFASGGAYKLAYNFTPGPPQPCVPAAYTIGAAQSGTLSPSSCRTSIGLADEYSVTLPSAGTLMVNVAATAYPPFSSQVAIRDTKDNLIALNQDLEGIGASHLTATLPAGSYTVLVSSTAGAGTYQLTSLVNPASIAPCGPGQALSLNGGFLWTLGVGSCVGANGQPMDPYQFTLPSAGVLAAIMTSSEAAGMLTLTDSNGNVLRSDVNSYGNNDPFIAQYLPAGNYQLFARDVTNSVGGTYQITLLDAPGPRPSFCGTTGQLSVGGSASGTLGITSCQYIDNTFTDIYQVTLANSTLVDLRMNSGDFDAYLTVLDAKGNLVAYDDDSGGGTNARINQSLPAGTYYVLAKQFGGYYPAGKYTLTLAGM
jgi:hypothetical protein